MTIYPAITRRVLAVLGASTMIAAAVLLGAPAADGAIVATVPLATSGEYAVLGGSTVTNTGASTLAGSLGLSPGTSITGFPPGLVLPPSTTNTTNAAAAQAQSDLTTAYDNAAGRPANATTTSDLANLTLQAGVYTGPGKSPLALSGPLVLDGAGDPTSVFVFQTDSTLITGSGSTVSLINGAQECNVFWQVASSATLGTGSTFTGTILALTSITVNNGVTVRGRALARNGAVTLDTDTFTAPTCADATGGTTTTTGGTTTTTGGTTTTTGATTTTTTGATTTTTGGTTTTTGATTTTTGGATTVATTGTPAAGGGTTARTTGGNGGGDASTGTATSEETGIITRLARPSVPAAPSTPGITQGGPGVPRVVGPPRTGGAPLRTHDATLPGGALATLAAGALVTALAASAVRSRRCRSVVAAGSGAPASVDAAGAPTGTGAAGGR